MGILGEKRQGWYYGFEAEKEKIRLWIIDFSELTTAVAAESKGQVGILVQRKHEV